MTDLNRRELLRAGAPPSGSAASVPLAGSGVSRTATTPKQATEKLVKAKIDGDLVHFNRS